MAKYKKFDSKELELKEKHQLLLASVAPRPIGFTASKSRDGYINLAPFSYHNAFSSNPPIVGISPAFSGRTGNPKNTLTNILDTKEFTLSVVTYDMVEQMNICAADYEPNVDEFKKGDQIIVNGSRVGELYHGGYSQYARVKKEFIIKKPEGINTKQAMMLGTGGFTAVVCAFAVKASTSLYLF